MKTDEQTLREALELLRAVQCREFSGIQCNGVKGENWFDARQRVLQAAKPAPEYETPEEYTKRTGEEVSDDALVWMLYQDSDMIDEDWVFTRWEEAREIKGADDECTVLAEKGKGAPPDDWRPEDWTPE